jgi:hypothetical protein
MSDEMREMSDAGLIAHFGMAVHRGIDEGKYEDELFRRLTAGRAAEEALAEGWRLVNEYGEQLARFNAGVGHPVMLRAAHDQMMAWTQGLAPECAKGGEE